MDMTEGLAFAVCCLFLGGLGYITYRDTQHRVDLMAECMADGKKEYECYAMLKQETRVVPIPVVIGR